MRNPIEISSLIDQPGQPVQFAPALSLQRQEWALEQLREQEAGSVLDVGCGRGQLLQVLCEPPSTIPEAPILAHISHSSFHFSSERRLVTESDIGRSVVLAKAPIKELFLHRVAGLDIDPDVIPKAIQVTSPPSVQDSSIYISPRWQSLQVEIWQGGLERHNERLEGFDAIVALEVIEHLHEDSLAKFPQMIFGTLRPRIVLITTPNFEFNVKFPRCNREESESHAKKGWLDPSKRTDRVFRHSDHKFEWTEQEFEKWCEGAEEWGYSCKIGGVGTSNQPSFHDNDRSRPLFASQTAIFKLESNPARSPRSFKTATLPFRLGGEALHPHKLVALHVHEPRSFGENYQIKSTSLESDASIRLIVTETFNRWGISQVSLGELWGVEAVSCACAGSKRILIRALGGWGNVSTGNDIQGRGDFEVFWPESAVSTLSVRWLAFEEQVKAQLDNVSRGATSSLDIDFAPPTEW